MNLIKGLKKLTESKDPIVMCAHYIEYSPESKGTNTKLCTASTEYFVTHDLEEAHRYATHLLETHSFSDESALSVSRIHHSQLPKGVSDKLLPRTGLPGFLANKKKPETTQTEVKE